MSALRGQWASRWCVLSRPRLYRPNLKIKSPTTPNAREPNVRAPQAALPSRRHKRRPHNKRSRARRHQNKRPLECTPSFRDASASHTHHVHPNTTPQRAELTPAREDGEQRMGRGASDIRRGGRRQMQHLKTGTRREDHTKHRAATRCANR